VANLNYILDNKLPEHAFALGETVIRPALQQIKKDYSEVGFVSGIGFAWSIIFAKPGTKQIDCDVAYDVVEKAFEKGLLFFAPVGAGSTIKIVPPLTMQKDALIEGLQVLREALCEVLGH
jgi:4-aminobutyrate aminotransferase-like enzyme